MPKSTQAPITFRPLVIFLILLGIDSLLLLLHLTFGTHNNFFHLDFERNLPTVLQGIKLISFGVFFLWHCLRTKVISSTRWFVIPLSLGMIGLGLDEMLEIHENIYRVFEYIPALRPEAIVETSLDAGYRSSLWILYYLPIIFFGLLWLGYWLRYFHVAIIQNFYLVLLLILLLTAIFVTEIMSTTGDYTPNIYFWLITIEEMAEMILASVLTLTALNMIGQTNKLSQKKAAAQR